MVPSVVLNARVQVDAITPREYLQLLLAGLDYYCVLSFNPDE